MADAKKAPPPPDAAFVLARRVRYEPLALLGVYLDRAGAEAAARDLAGRASVSDVAYLVYECPVERAAAPGEVAAAAFGPPARKAGVA